MATSRTPRRSGDARQRERFPAGVPTTLPADAEALYRALFGVLREAIHDGLWQPGDLLPSEASIGARFGISRITVRHALQLLQNEGYIRSRRAHRSIVLAREPLIQSGQGVDTIDDLIRAATDYDLRPASWRREREPDVAGLFGLPADAAVDCLRGTLLSDGHPLSRMVIYFDPAVGGQLKLRSFDDPVVFRVLQRKLGIRISDVRMTVWAEVAGADDVAELGCAEGSAMFCTRIVYSGADGRPVEVTYARSPAALRRYSFRIAVGG